MKAIIIGSGISGMTAAATLAQKGFEVSVFEQFPQVSGVSAVLTAGYKTARKAAISVESDPKYRP